MEVLTRLVPVLRMVNEGGRALDVAPASLLRSVIDRARIEDSIGVSPSALTRVIGRPDCRLAAYGSLAPGESNHSQLGPLSGFWEEGSVRGHLERVGWGEAIGFPGMRWDPEGEAIRVKLFTSEDLPTHWQRLDEFEGADYRRILIPVETEDSVVVANIYELAAD